MALARFLVLAILLGFLPGAAATGVLYKSVDANGVIMFSDVPPPEGARILEERPLPSSHSPSPGLPVELAAPVPGVMPAEQMLDFDAAIASANAKVDEAERALAQARRELSPASDRGMRLRPTRLASEDDQRLEPYRNAVKIARRHLVELLRERQLAMRP
jgi:hypothetical protein